MLIYYYDVTIFLIVTVFSIVLIDEFFRRRRWRKFPYRVPSAPVIGSVYYAVGRKDCFALYSEWFNKFHAPFYVRAFYEDFYVTMNSEEIRKILLASDCLNKGDTYDLFKTFIPNSILIAERDIWTPKRRAFSKAFSQMRLNKVLPHINVTSDRLVDALTSRKNEPIKEIFERIVIDGAMATLLGCDEAIKDNPLLKKMDMYSFIRLLFLGVAHRYLKPWLYFDFIYLHTQDGKNLVRMFKDIHNAVSYIMKSRREMLQHNKAAHRDRDLITISVKENISEEDVVSDIITFLFAAYETSAATIGLALTLLGMHKNFQEELYNEAMDVVGNSNYIDYEQLSKLKYTEMVLNETLRLFPSFPFIVRKLDTDVDLGDRVLPNSSNVIVSIFGVHRSEKYWENPLEFNPYRFLPEEVGKRGPTTFMPFSVGPRNCIGSKYSMMVMKTILAKIISSYEVSSSFKSIEEIKIHAFVSLDIENIECTFAPRSRSNGPNLT